MGIVVENPGVLTTIQDKGRYGYEQFGVSPSGPMDLESFQIANILVGNSRDLSALEATMLAWEQVGFTGAFGVTFALNAASVALGELIACYGLGSLLLWRLPKMPFFKNRMK